MKRVLFLVVYIFNTLVVFSQVKNIVIDSVNDASHGGPNEPCIAIDPKNPSHMVAGANLANVYTSLDGGYTWQKNNIASSYGVWGDPVVIADTTGAFYYFHLADNSSITIWPEWCDRMVCQRADDIATGVWADGSYAGLHPAPIMEDKPWVAVDRNTNAIYITWTKFDKYGSISSSDSSNIMFSKSVDRGNTWTTPVRLNKVAGDCTDSDPTVEGAVPCVGTHGEIFVAWASFDAIIFDRSYDTGNTWLSDDIFVTSVPGGWDYVIPGLTRCNGLPFTSCDISNSPYRGNIYINWTDQRNGADNTDVWICKSTDNGDTWSAPIRVNDDTGAKQQFMSSMTVDPSTGNIYVLFYDRRNADSFPMRTDVYLAVSRDGAATFKNYRINDTPFYPVQSIFFGDYTYVSAFNNVVRPIWGSVGYVDTALRQKIVTAIIDSTMTGAGVPAVSDIVNRMEIYPNPVVQNAVISCLTVTEQDVSIYVTDVTGRIVARVRDGYFLHSGVNNISIDLQDYNLSQGVYFLCLRSRYGLQVVKMLVMK